MPEFPYPAPRFADDAEIAELARLLRCEIICMTHRAGSGHPGGSLSAVELVALLYTQVMRHDPADPERTDRDRFVLSKGHACPVLYAVLAHAGYFPAEELCELRRIGELLQGHPSVHIPGVDASTGSLGQGLSIANGMALAAKLDGTDQRVYCLLGDGELDEGQVWEAAMTAYHYKLDNLTAIVDRNGLQIDGDTEEVMSLEPLDEKWEAFGFHVIECDGHSLPELRAAFAEAQGVRERPVCLIADTHKGKGVSFMEDVADWHGKAPDEALFRKAIRELSGGEPYREACCLKYLENSLKGGGA
ncbi:MAG: transketolase [Candidatus Coatesbacteria bacterium]|nr:transketolase [Candidatus Coatesbacteria bacterium]